MNIRKRIIFELERLRRKNLQQLHPLQQLFWESTLRCNVHCLHCGSDCSSSEVTPDMPAEDFLRVIDQSVTPHVDPHKVLIIISGGEPLMRKDLAEVGAALKQRGYPWGMVTNGLALTEKRFKELMASGLRSMAISFDGMKDNHNWLRQHPLAFEGATRAIKLAAALQRSDLPSTGVADLQRSDLQRSELQRSDLQRSDLTNIATCIYTGMMTDTGNFSFNSNYPEMYQIVGELVSFGVNKDEIYNRVFNAYSADRMRLMGYCLYQKMRIFPECHTALIYLSRKELYRFNFQSGDAEGIVNLPLQIKDIHYSCFMREDKVNPTEVALAGGSKTKIKISLRSQGDRPVNVFAKDIFGGGGHANASGGEYYGPLIEAVQLFIDNYPQYFAKE